jgi:hypothetical protein
MKYYIEAYDGNGLQVLGNLDGQGVISKPNFRRTKRYKELPTFRTLNDRIAYYKIVDYETGRQLDEVINKTFNGARKMATQS